VDYRITPEDRSRFKRCRRQWDFASQLRRGLEPANRAESGILPTAFRDALAVYYYPGTWDWLHDLKQSLVHKALQRALGEAGALDELATATALIDAYDGWAVTVDDFAPVKIDHEVSALVRDPDDLERGLLTADGSGVTYLCRVDLLAVDASDEYWVVCHRIVENWQAVEELLLDEEATAACWAWEQDYIGMEIAGTIHNEVRLGAPLDAPDTTGAVAPVAQHEASGGGRSIPQHVRRGARESRPDPGGRVEQRTAGVLRRTRIRRSRDEIDAVGRLLAAEILEMTGVPRVYPSPGQHCLACEFTAPCLSLFEGADPEPALAKHFRPRADNPEQKPRLGQATWGFGRGAAPPGW
jgi:hypothetical protein